MKNRRSASSALVHHLSPRGGMSLVEILVAITILAVGLLAIATAGSVAARQVLTGRRDIAVWSAVQQQVELLMSQGYKNVKTDSATVQGYPLRWTVSGTNPKKLLLQATWSTPASAVVRDTLVLYFAAQDTLP